MNASTTAILFVTLKVALTATAVVCVPAVILGYKLSRSAFWGKSVVETLVALPLVLPPTAVGYLLLRLFAFDGPLGGLGFDLLLTWQGAVMASAIMSLPLVVRTARVAFEGVNPRLELMARTLGYSRTATFLRFSVPLASRGLLAALILGFTRAIGEFGATVIVAGNIPGRTQTLSLAIFSAQQLGDQDTAGVLLLIAVVLGFVAVFIVERLSHR